MFTLLATTISTLEFLFRFFFLRRCLHGVNKKKKKKKQRQQEEQDFMHNRVIEHSDGVHMASRQPPGTMCS